MPIVCILSQPFRKSRESEKLNDAKKSREDWGSPIFVPVSLRFFPAFYISPAFHNLNAWNKVVFFRKSVEMAKQLCCSIFCLLTFFFSPYFFQLSGKWINLMRAFKKLDKDNSDFLTLKEFRHVLELCNVVLDEEDIYHILTEFDENKEKKIRYTKFLDKIK